MADLVALSELIRILQKAIDTRRSGAIFITSAANHSAMVTLEKGRVTGLKYRSARGYEAAAEIAAIEQLKFQMADEPTRLPNEPELDSETVLDILSGRGSSPDDPGASGRAPTTGFGGASLDAVRDRCVAAIGPIGAALFDEAMEVLGDEVSTAEGYRKLVEQLAAQIDDEAESGSFRRDLLSE